MDNLLAALSIEGWCNDHTWAILSRVLPEGATICDAPGRWGPSKSRARSTMKQRPPSTSRRNIVPHSSIFIICWCRISGMGVYEEKRDRNPFRPQNRIGEEISPWTGKPGQYHAWIRLGSGSPTTKQEQSGSLTKYDHFQLGNDFGERQKRLNKIAPMTCRQLLEQQAA